MAEPAIALAETRFETAPTLPALEVFDGGGQTTPPTGQLEVVEDFSGETTVYPDVVRVSEIPGDEELVTEAQRNIRASLVGGLAVGETVNADKKPIKNIAESIIWASRGDAEGISMTDSNVGTEMIEQAYKAGNVVTIKMKAEGDYIYQHGQRLNDVQRNAYQLASDDPIIKPRTEAEANNAARLKRLYDAGLLEDNVFVRFSMCAEGVSDEKLDELKFFSSTKSISVQADYSENGELIEEVAMVAGVKEQGGERHDREMIEGVARQFGHNYEGMNAAEIIGDGFLIPKKYLKDGVIDIVRMMDDIKGTFFGKDEPRQDYKEFKKFCEQRAARFTDDIVAVRNQLIDEVDKLKNNAVVASMRLAKLIEGKVVDRAFEDTSIDPYVMGEESAKNIIRARELAAAGEHHEAQAFLQVARATAKGGSCPAAFLEMLKNSGEVDNVSTISAKNAWAGTEEPKKGICVNCDKKTLVGVKSWCKSCIKGHCG